MLTPYILGRHKWIYARKEIDVTSNLLYLRFDSNDIYLLIKILLRLKDWIFLLCQSLLQMRGDCVLILRQRSLTFLFI